MRDGAGKRFPARIYSFRSRRRERSSECDARGARGARKLGGVDVLICTTGPSHPPQLLKDIPIGDIQTRLNEIVLPPLHMMHACLPAMRAQESGAIVNVASDAAKLATPGETLIGAAMASIVMFSKAAALEEKRLVFASIS